MLKNIAKFEKEIGDKTYQFLLDTDSNLTHAKEALYQFLGVITQIEEANKAKAAAETPPASPAAAEGSPAQDTSAPQ